MSQREQEQWNDVFRHRGRRELKSFLSDVEKDLANPPFKSRRIWLQPNAPWRPLAAACLLLLVALAALFWYKNLQPGPTDTATLAMEYFEPYPNVIAPITKSATEATDYERAFQLYEANQLMEARTTLLTLPDSAEKYFYLGQIALIEGRSMDALRQLNRISDQHRLSATAWWFSAIAHLQENDSDQARLLLQRIAQDGSHPYQRRATELLQDLAVL